MQEDNFKYFSDIVTPEIRGEMPNMRREMQKEYEETLAKIESGNADSFDFINMAQNMRLLFKKYDKAIYNDYLEKAYVKASQEIRDYDTREKAAYVFSQYYYEKNDYKNSVKYLEESFNYNPFSYYLAIEIYMEKLSDKKNAKRIYNQALSSSVVPEEIMELMRICLNSKTRNEERLQQAIVWIIAFILGILCVYFEQI